MGGHWGAELKYAGYDGVVIRGRAPEPVYLWIEDGKAELREAKGLWGMGNYATTSALRTTHGPRVRVVSCGPAGERLSRVAVIQTETGNAAGQGGYGALMGAKRLKAIAVRGTGGVRLAHPEAFMDLCLNGSREGQRPDEPGSDYYPPGEAPSGPGYRTRKCGFCATPSTHRLYMAVPGRTTGATHTVARQCWGYDATSRDAELEARAITSDYGLNGWEIAYGIIPWLQLCRQQGLLDRIDGMQIPVPDRPIGYLRDVAPVSGEFLGALVRAMALREGELAMPWPMAPATPPTSCLVARESRCWTASIRATAGRPSTGVGTGGRGARCTGPGGCRPSCSGAWIPATQRTTAPISGPSTSSITCR